ncbi:MAG: hypothetical protein JNM33_11020, partial [Rubrivivax sp.]|nr:hypothetical protein [Rubrivivax sp.]
EVTLGAANSDSSARQNFACISSFSATGGVALNFDIRCSYGAGTGTPPLLYVSAMRITEVKR